MSGIEDRLSQIADAIRFGAVVFSLCSFGTTLVLASIAKAIRDLGRKQ